MFQEQKFNAGGIQINFIQASTSGKPLVLLHGTASEWQSYLTLIPEFSDNFKVFALDLRGHGGSSWVPGKYRLLDYAEDIKCFLETHIGQPGILYGHSLGAQIALAVASLTPSYVDALVLCEPPFYYHRTTMKDTMWYEPFIELHSVISKFHSAKEIDDFMAEQYPTMDEHRRKSRADTLSHVDPDAVLAILEDRHIEGYEVDTLLRQIACPVSLIQGHPELGAALPDEDLKYMVERIPNCHVIRMPDVGHGLPAGDSLLSAKKFIASV